MLSATTRASRSACCAPLRDEQAQNQTIYIHTFDCRLDKTSAAKTGADRLHTVPNVENTRAGLKHKRTEEKEVVAADQNDLSIGTISKQPFEVPCCCQATDAASEN